jgi:putative transposase
MLDKSLTSMRDLFYHLNHSGISVDISSFSKACKQWCEEYLRHIYTKLKHQLKFKHRCSMIHASYDFLPEALVA